MDDSKFQRKMATEHMETLRGYNLKPESTFYQSRDSGGRTAAPSAGMSGTKGSTLPKITTPAKYATVK